MAGITLAQAQAQLDALLAASLAVANNQSYEMPDGRTLTRMNAAWIDDRITFWNGMVKQLTPGGGIVVRGVTPVMG
jgi:hypothetical protein